MVDVFVEGLSSVARYIIPVLLVDLSTAVVISIAWGLTVLTLVSYVLARSQGVKPWKVIIEHLVIALMVIGLTHVIGDWIGERFS